MRRGRAIVTTDTNDAVAAVDAARRIHAESRLDGVLSSCDYYLPLAAEIAAELGLPGPRPEAVGVACDKRRTRDRLDRAGIPGPRHRLVPLDDEAGLVSAVEHVGFPLVVKPTDLCAGMFVRRADGWAEVAAAAAELRRFEVNARGQWREPVVLLEEYLVGPEFSVESWVRGGEIHTVGVTDKSLGGASGFVETGHMFPARLDAADRAGLVSSAESAIRAVGLDHGVVHTELRLTGAGPRIIEINPRPAGNQITELIRHVEGIDLPRVAVELALGRDPSTAGGDDTGGRPRSAAVQMLVPDRVGVLDRIDGASGVAAHPAIAAVDFKQPGHRVTVGADNNSYLGSVLVTSDEPTGARPIAEQLMATISVGYREESAP
ncbi:ATP-grasp domain-containing protein [Rhodococcus sp. MTM3W5.2]|uniref:ATP-grasp domain-containing protein n=1 Tax=Rhodococcus sp. MTM3W5.2 TaxID=1805827 RepID=UPI001CB93F78|nr:ATP-grasp domain-containing protein [Rhodococcus sp. MTM3W5.2]